MRRLLILGAGAFAQEVAELAHDAGFTVIGFVEGVDRTRRGDTLNGQPVYWVEDIASLADSCEAVCAIGSPKRAALIQRAIELNTRFTAVIHPRAHMAASTSTGSGALVSAGAIIGARCDIGSHVIVNRGCLIGHHVKLGELVTLGPGTNIGGGAEIGVGTQLGMGAIVLDNVRIGAHAIVGAGAVVTQDVPAAVQVIGVPARPVKALD